MPDIYTIEVPWNKYPAMKVWRVVKKVPPRPESPWKSDYAPADSKYKGYPHRADAVKEAQRLTEATGEPHVTIRAYLVPCEKEAS